MKSFEIMITKSPKSFDYIGRTVRAKDLSDLRRRVLSLILSGKASTITVIKNENADYGMLYRTTGVVRWAASEGPTPKNNCVSAKTGRLVGIETYWNDLQSERRV